MDWYLFGGLIHKQSTFSVEKQISIFEVVNQKNTYCFFYYFCFNTNIDPKEGLNPQLNCWGFFVFGL